MLPFPREEEAKQIVDDKISQSLAVAVTNVKTLSQKKKITKYDLCPETYINEASSQRQSFVEEAS